MKKIRMAMTAVALVAGMSTVALAQGGNGGGRNGGGMGRAPRWAGSALFQNVTLSGADSAKIHTIDSVFSAARTKFMQDNNLMAQGRQGGGAAGGGAPATPPAAATDDQKAKFKPVADQYIKDVKAVLTADQQKAVDANAASWNPLQMGGRGPRGGGR